MERYSAFASQNYEFAIAIAFICDYSSIFNFQEIRLSRLAYHHLVWPWELSSTAEQGQMEKRKKIYKRKGGDQNGEIFSYVNKNYESS